jgi:phospholipid transport system substrate-binding protein
MEADDAIVLASRRRGLLRAGAAISCCWLARAPLVFAANPDWAVAFIRRVGWELADILTRPDAAQDREASLRGLIDQVVDVDYAARFCLGRYWSRASPRQQREYVVLFHDVLMRTILAHIGQESRAPAALQLSVEASYANQDEVFVPMVITRGGLPPFRVTWAVNDDVRNPRIVDVMAEQVSLRVTIRSDFNAFLTRHDGDIDAFLQALRRQSCVGCGGRQPGNR